MNQRQSGGESKAQKLLYLDIMEGHIPRKAKDNGGKSTMKLKDIYNSRSEFQQYHYSNFLQGSAHSG